VSENEVSELKRLIECVQIDCNRELERRRKAEREAAAEREACARAVESWDGIAFSPARDRKAIADAIRARGIDHGLDAAKGPDLELLTRPELYALIEMLRK